MSAVDAGSSRSAVLEHRVQVVIMLAIGAAAGAASFTHVHDVAAAHGQAGWVAAAVPALGFLVMVKIAMAHTGTGVTPDHAPSPAVVITDAPAADEVARPGSGGPKAAEMGRPAARTAIPAGPGTSSPVIPAVGEVPSTKSDPVVEALLPIGRVAADALGASGRKLSRAALAEVLRRDGYAASNARMSTVLRQLRAEGRDQPFVFHQPRATAGRGGELTPASSADSDAMSSAKMSGFPSSRANTRTSLTSASQGRSADEDDFEPDGSHVGIRVAEPRSRRGGG